MAEKQKKKQSKLARFFKILGPGLITGASGDDPSGNDCCSGCAFILSICEIEM